ncbi:MAG: hypothetical protein ACTHJ4_01875 [Candidatus Nucleicultricaceae bacterium]
MLKHFIPFCLAFILLSKPAISSETQPCPFTRSEFNAIKSVQFLDRYFEKKGATFNGKVLFCVNDGITYRYFPIHGLISALRFYQFTQYNRLSRLNFEFANAHAFLFNNASHLITKLMQQSDDSEIIDTNEYWSGLILYHFLSPAASTNKEIDSAFHSIMTRLWNNAQNRSEIEALFIPTLIIQPLRYPIAGAKVLPDPLHDALRTQLDEDDLKPNQSPSKMIDYSDSSILDQLEAHLKTLRLASDDDLDASE